MAHELLDAARRLGDWMTGLRRDFHMHPELSLAEEATARRCGDELEKLGFRISRGLWGHGLIADLDAGGASSRIALRADMDALPIQERNEIEYRSRNDGVAHMCGHDTHMAILLGAARLLSERHGSLKRHVRLLLQPSEELPPGGAKGMIGKGALEGVDEVYGLHNQPLLEAGTIATRPGALTAAADRFYARVLGRGGHASRPDNCLDPIPVACALVAQWQTLISRRCPPATQAVLSVTQIEAGTTFNIIPDSCFLQGTVRSYEAEVRDLIEREMNTMAANVAAAHGLNAEFTYERGYDSIVNDAAATEAVCAVAREVAGETRVDGDYPAQPWGEDFAYFLQERPGCYFLLGSGNREKGICEPLHSARFNVDESCLPVGAAVMAGLALR